MELMIFLSIKSKDLKHFVIEPYAAVFEDLIERIKPSSILVGATNIGRSLAPRNLEHG